MTRFGTARDTDRVCGPAAVAARSTILGDARPMTPRAIQGRWCLAAAGLLACGDPAGADDTTSGTTQIDPATSAAATSSTATSTSPSGSSTTAPGESTAVADDTQGSSETTGPTGPLAVLDIYWIDTEGGAATLLVTPEGPLVLVDAGNPGSRDAERIRAVVVDELGADRIDLCIVTHYHSDHVGGVPELASLVPIDAFWDHGDSVEAGGGQGLELWQDYLAVADGSRTVVTPGVVETIGGLELTIVSAATDVLGAALPGSGARNPACPGAENMPPDLGENGNSVGLIARFGDFELLDLGDLTWSYEDELACPLDRVGPVDLYQTTHHGLAVSGATQLVHGIDPLVVVMNNGAFKGGAPETFERIATAPSTPDLWQSHRALGNDDDHNAPEERIANLEDGDGDAGFAIHARIDETGSITITNRRNDHARVYQARP